MEGLPIVSDVVSAALRLSGVSASLELLKDLQHMHDFNEPMYWPDQFQSIAEKWHLDK